MTNAMVLSIRSLRGPNLWAREAVLEVTARCDEELAKALAQETLRLQIACGAVVSTERVACSLEPGTHVFAVGMEDVELAQKCLAAALESRPASAETVKQLRDLADDIVLGPNTRALWEAVRRRGIPVRRLGQGSLLILGHGVRQQRLWGASTGKTSAIAEMVGREKPLTKQLLSAVGLPVPEGRLVADAADAVKAAVEIGCPVVVKPDSANHGNAVFIGLTNPFDIEAAYEAASVEGSTPGGVVVERCVEGAEFRVLVVGGKVAAAMRGDPLYVIGDGKRSLRELVDEVNLDPARGDSSNCPLYPVQFDAVMLATLQRQGLMPESVVGPEERVLLQRNGNLRSDATNDIHPLNAAACVLAAQTVGLDIAGIDLVARDISVPLREQGAAIIEVNSMPGFMMHDTVPVADIIVRELYPDGCGGRIPLAAVYGNGASVFAAHIHALLQTHGIFTALVSPKGVTVGSEFTPARGRAIISADVLLHPRLEAAVFEIPEQAIIEEGAAFEFCDVLVLTASTSLTKEVRLLIDCVTQKGAILVPKEAEWASEVVKLRPELVQSYPDTRGSEISAASVAVQTLMRPQSASCRLPESVAL